MAALESGLLMEARGTAHNIAKAMGRWGDGAATHGLGAMFPEAGLVGWKTWAVTKTGGAVTYELFSAETGALLAIMEAKTLGATRTAAMTGLGTRWLSRPDAETLAVIGGGRQALAQVAAINLVRPLRQVWVHSRSEDRREAFAATVRSRLPSLNIETTPSVEAATAQADIVTTITRAQEPFLEAAMLRHGTHLNAIGAIFPTHAEFGADVLDRADFIAVDTLPDVKRNSREFREHFGEGDWSQVHPLSAVIGGAAVRPDDADLTVFKSLGMGISDLSVASEIYRRAVAGAVGTPLTNSPIAPMRWS